MMTLADLGTRFDRNRERWIEDWKQFLAFPSVSADPAHAVDCLACAQWLKDSLTGMGLATKLLETPGKPVVYAECTGGPGPTVLFYGHYDVQPADPLELWQSPPFAPELRNGRLYARGSEDNKGQVWFVLKALETLLAQDALHANVKILIEGEEEYSSRGISASLTEWRDLLRADLLMVCDTGMHRSGAPAIVMGLRGIIHLSVTLSGPDHDLHSGLHGGVAPNPAQGLARLVGSLHREDGTCAVSGFYDDVTAPSDAERRAANAIAFDAESYRRDTGAPPVAGEPLFTPAERLGFRPTIDVNGLQSGYAGAGMKTIIPSSATAKLTARLVPNQDPRHCLDAICRHLQRHVPTGLRLDVTESGIGGAGFRLPLDSPWVTRARAILSDVTGAEPVFEWEGASIPIVSRLAEVSGAEPLLIGFGREEDRIHAPNESFSIEQFRLGYLYAASLLASL